MEHKNVVISNVEVVFTDNDKPSLYVSCEGRTSIDIHTDDSMFVINVPSRGETYRIPTFNIHMIKHTRKNAIKTINPGGFDTFAILPD